jgi:hypothetical protein
MPTYCEPCPLNRNAIFGALEIADAERVSRSFASSPAIESTTIATRSPKCVRPAFAVYAMSASFASRSVDR